jgi:quercetin dioxygenase-like cupin family protein
MSSGSRNHERDHVDSVCLHAVQALPASEIPVVEEQIATCPDCRKELEALLQIVDAFVSWRTDVLRPSTSLWERLTRRIAVETGQPLLPEPARPDEPEWQEAAPGITCKLLATDVETGRVSMLVRLAPGAEYPPHTHAGVEELHMLHGELMVNGRRLRAGDYLRSEPGTTDHRVWSETGCTGVLLTSARDVLL